MQLEVSMATTTRRHLLVPSSLRPSGSHGNRVGRWPMWRGSSGFPGGRN